jgi:xanthine dehydrogenase YagR molybdenum-binding subunit
MPREPQADGWIIWGTGQALEKPETDPVMGRSFNGSYSGYLVPTNAHIPEADVEFTGDFDHEPSLVGAKALGELTAASAAPAIANGVYHATGTPVRDLPITVETLL